MIQPRLAVFEPSPRRLDGVVRTSPLCLTTVFLHPIKMLQLPRVSQAVWRLIFWVTFWEIFWETFRETFWEIGQVICPAVRLLRCQRQTGPNPSEKSEALTRKGLGCWRRTTRHLIVIESKRGAQKSIVHFAT